LAGHTKMAATGFTPISLYYTTTASAAPTAGNLVAGELALNNNDGKLFYKDSSGVVQTIATKATAALPTTTTGSGNVVLSTSPTLVTPALGTPSALVLTNATGLGYAALPTGSILQVVQSTSTTAFSTSSGTMVATGISASITPKFSTSKILVRITAQVAASAAGAGIAIYRATTSIWSPNTNDGSGFYGIYPGIICLNNLEYLDSPATTSSTTYNLYLASRSGLSSAVGTNNAGTVITLMEVAG